MRFTSTSSPCVRSSGSSPAKAVLARALGKPDAREAASVHATASPCRDHAAPSRIYDPLAIRQDWGSVEDAGEFAPPFRRPHVCAFRTSLVRDLEQTMRTRTKHILGRLGGLTVLTCVAAPAMAQERSTFTNPVCSVINFRFCDQGIAPSPVPPPPTVSGSVPPPPDEQAVRTPSPKQKQVARAKKAARGKQPKEAPPAEDVDPSQN